MHTELNSECDLCLLFPNKRSRHGQNNSFKAKYKYHGTILAEMDRRPEQEGCKVSLEHLTVPEGKKVLKENKPVKPPPPGQRNQHKGFPPAETTEPGFSVREEFLSTEPFLQDHRL